jgi:DNA polymerase IV
MQDSGFADASSSPAQESAPLEKPPVDFSTLPIVYVLDTHFGDLELHELEESLHRHGAELTYDIHEARIIFGKVAKRRAIHDLRVRGLRLEEISSPFMTINKVKESEGPPAKRRRLDPTGKTYDGRLGSDVSTTDDDTVDEEAHEEPHLKDQQHLIHSDRTEIHSVEVLDECAVVVITEKWVKDSLAAGTILPMQAYLVYASKRTTSSTAAVPSQSQALQLSSIKIAKVSPSSTSLASRQIIAERPQSIIDRATVDAASLPSKQSRSNFMRNKFSRRNAKHQPDNHKSQSKALLQSTTSEYENSSDNELPEPPDWVKKRIKYACQRSTPQNPPNKPFIDLLLEIRKTRTLNLDEIGVRAYSTSIASIAAYPYAFTSAREILRLPGCDTKIANLWIEFKNTGRIKEVEDAQNDPTLKILKIFYDIWGVGAHTAREFYFERGWTDLDDLVEFGWTSLTRVQQIGVKYFDEFLTPMPRNEVEDIAAVVQRHAIKVRDKGIEVVIVGGYRRGKELNNDVDVIVSHRDINATAHLITDIVKSLEEEDWISHTLLITENNTARGQSTLPFRAGRGENGGGAGHSFDSLDKAFLLFQNPDWSSKETDLAANPRAKNPNTHRRLDIIISPWRTVGCAIVGWSGATTFERDIRRYVKHKFTWKFDSSGIRHRKTGQMIRLEGEKGAETWQEAEKMVFEGMGLPFVEPMERWTY